MTHPWDPSNQVSCGDQKQSIKKKTKKKAKSKTEGGEGFTERERQYYLPYNKRINGKIFVTASKRLHVSLTHTDTHKKDNEQNEN